MGSHHRNRWLLEFTQHLYIYLLQSRCLGTRLILYINAIAYIVNTIAYIVDTLTYIV